MRDPSALDAGGGRPQKLERMPGERARGHDFGQERPVKILAQEREDCGNRERLVFS